MASLKLITISFLVNVLAIFVQTCTCEFSSHPSHLYTEAHFTSKIPSHGSVVYVPVCRPDCCTPSHPHQSHFTHVHPEKTISIGNLPLQQHTQTYHPQLDVGKQHLQSQSGESNHHYQHLKHEVPHKEHDSGSAEIYQQNDHHSSEQKQAIHHHGSGVSHQHFKQEHQPSHHGDYSSQVHDEIDYDKHDEHHHKKDHNIHYRFEYSVDDHKTGDVKRHKEERQGDLVNGEYALLEEDGNVRTVKYQADWKSGFHAQIHNSKHRS